MPNPVVYYPTPVGCDVCGRALGDIMYDCRVPSAGMWGIVDPDCFRDQGCRIGTGLGQKYQRQKDGRFLKIGG